MISACDVILPNGVRCLAQEILRVRLDFRAQTIEADIAYWQNATDQANAVPPVGMEYPRIPIAELPQTNQDALGAVIVSYLATQAETLIGAQTRGCNVIDAEAGAVRARFVTVASAQDSTYAAKYAQAQAYLAAGFPDDASAYPWIASEALATGATPKATAEGIKGKGDIWANVIGPKIEGVRIAAKDKITSAATIDAALNAMRAGLEALQAIQ